MWLGAQEGITHLAKNANHVVSKKSADLVVETTYYMGGANPIKYGRDIEIIMILNIIHNDF